MLHFFFGKLLSICLPSSTLFSNWKVFFQKQYKAVPIRSKMTLVNVVPHVVLHQKTHVPRAETFVGRSNGVRGKSPIHQNLAVRNLIVQRVVWIIVDSKIFSLLYTTIRSFLNRRKRFIFYPKKKKPSPLKKYITEQKKSRKKKKMSFLSHLR